MQLIANDLSLHRQFYDFGIFRDSVSTVQMLRSTAKRFGRDIHCGRNLLHAEPLRGVPMSQAIARLSPDQRRATMSWLTSGGPFWDDLRQHGPDDYLDCEGAVVTDSGVGEAAFKSLFGDQCALVSFVPSDWDYAPIEVALKHAEDGVADRVATLPNWRSVSDLERGLADVSLPIRTWDELKASCDMRFTRLCFAEDAFAKLAGVPFTTSFSPAGRRVARHRRPAGKGFWSQWCPHGRSAANRSGLYFSGENAPFSDSSVKEKREFRDRLMFSHPMKKGGESIWCPWHGKVRSLTLRIHFFLADSPQRTGLHRLCRAEAHKTVRPFDLWGANSYFCPL